MSNAVILTFYKLKEGASVPDFLLAADRFHEVFVLKQKGLISCKLIANDELWGDYSVWESMADFKNADPQTPDEHNAISNYFSFIDTQSAADYHFNVEKSY
ncbi:MAG: hypothetical protein FWH16_01565 [Oscillospiraceae bacterium]|nr:hypothetical protein [Oscillospiraceae bacterium]